MQASAQTVIHNKYGFHVRPSTGFVKLAQTFKSNITVQKTEGGPEVDGKMMMVLMTLGASCGCEIKISAQGEDAQEAVKTLIDYVNSGFGGIE